MARTKKRPTKTKRAASKRMRAATPARSSAVNELVLRIHLVKLLNADTAHLDFDKVISGWPEAHRGVKPAGAPHTAWQLLEHLRIGQWDILEFIRNPKHKSPEWPSGYWPPGAAPPNKAAWEESIKAFHADREAMQHLVADEKTDLFARVPHGTGQTILREALLVADHNAYHIGQLVLLRRLLGAWPE